MTVPSAVHGVAPRIALALVVGALLLGPAAASAVATTFHVTTASDPASGTSCPSASSCSLRQAISQAADGDTIDVPAFHITLNSGLGELHTNNSITVVGSGAGSTVIDGGNSSRVFHVIGPAPSFAVSNASVTLRDLAVTGGSVTRVNAASQAGGGGIQNDSNGTLHLVGVAVTRNSFTASSVSSFARSIGGAGIFSLSTVDLTGSTVSHNDLSITGAQGTSGGGGVLVTGGDLVLADSSISDNTATLTEGSNTGGEDGGGGAFLSGSDDVILENSTLAGNTVHVMGVSVSGDGGGGLYQTGISVLASGSTFSGNVADIGTDTVAGGGGAVFDVGGGSAYTNSTFQGNSVQAAASVSDQGGGAIYYAGAGISSLANDTFSGNSASGGGATLFDAGTRLVPADTILSKGSGSVANCTQDSSDPGTVASDGYNLYDDTANSCALTASGDHHVSSPHLAPLAFNGGLTQTMALLPASAAINAGNPQGCTDAFGHALNVDERGVSRPQPNGGRCDIGAYELAPPLALTGLAGAVARGTATLQGTARNADALSGRFFFQYGRSTAYGKTTASQPLAAGATAHARAVLSKLAPGTYHYRLVVVNADGTSRGADSTFLVPAVQRHPAPAVLTGEPGSITAHGATFTGEFEGFGLATRYEFEFGRTRHYGMKTRLQSVRGTNRIVAVSAVVGGLLSGKTYHYRLVAISSSGRTFGSDEAFPTK